MSSPSTSLTLALGQGTRILLTVADPAGKVVDLIPSQVRGPLGGNLKIGAKRGGWYAPAMLVSVVNGVRTYQVVVPAGGTYQPVVWTTLNISGGASASSAGATPTAPASITVGGSDLSYSLGTVQ